jgi:hypothetical protein
MSFLLSFGSDKIQINGIKNDYNRVERMKYSLCNLSKSEIFMNIALEAKLNNNWQEVIVDVTKITVKSAVIYDIKQEQRKYFVYDLRTLDRALFKNKQVEIRLKVYYGNKIDDLKSIVYSKVIKVQ